MSLAVKRVYDTPSRSDGVRVLVDRLWPRGLSKAEAHIDVWLRDVAPSNELRRFYGHDRERWPEFKRRYFAELDANPEAARALAERVRGRRATLLFGTRETERNNATALVQYLERRRRSARRRGVSAP